MNMIVGAYSASPCHSEWNPELEKAYFDGLKKIPGIRGLELPFFGDLHRYDSEWLLNHLVPSWDYVFTCIPGTMENVKASPHFGLASDSERGRADALLFAEKARQAILRMHQKLGRKAVRAIEIHSAPTRGRSGVNSSWQSLSRSLAEMCSWDWDGATLMLEHCDRFIEGQEPAKGYLSIEDEIRAVVKESCSEKTPLQILINWGRSVIEARDPKAVLDHLSKARDAGVLGGLIFSGCTPEHPLYGAFADSHAPFAGNGPDLEPASWMTQERVKEALRVSAAHTLPIVGFKIQALPRDLTVADRLRKIENWVQLLKTLQFGEQV